MKNDKTIKIKCKGSRLELLDKLEIIQGDLKELSKENLAKLRKRIETKGFDAPIFVWKNNILDGTQRKKVLDDMLADGWILPDNKVPVCDIEAKNIQEAKDRLLGYISQYGKITETGLSEFLATIDVPDLETIDLPDFDFESFQNERSETEGLTDDDAVPEVPKKAKTKTGDLYILGEHRLLCGDSTKQEDVERLMDGQKVDLCFTSPPYSDLRDYNNTNNLNPEKLSDFIKTSNNYVNYFCINLGIKREKGEIVEYWQIYIEKAKSLGLKLLSWNVWNRENAGFSVGQITAMFAIQHEFIFVFGKETQKLKLTITNKTAGEFNDHSWNRNQDGSLTKGNDLYIRKKRQLGTVLTCINEQSRKFTKEHPAIYPVHLPLAYIEAFNTDCYDPFLGSGSTMIACEKLNRKCFGMEIDPVYCDVIVKRWEDFTGKKAVLVKSK